MKQMADIIRSHGFLHGLPDDTIALIAGCAKNAVFRPNEYLCREGTAADAFYLIRHGAVALEIFAPGRGPFTFLTVKDDEILGADWLMPPYRWSFDARAVELTRAFVFDAKCLRDKCEADHHVGYEMMKRFVPPLIRSLQSARLQSLEIVR